MSPPERPFGKSSDPAAAAPEIPSAEINLAEDRVSAHLMAFETREVSLHSSDWAGIAKPFTWFVLSLLTAVVVLPFLMLPVLAHVSPGQVTTAFDWAKTVLAPVTGFGGAVIGYYYGTRGQKGA